MSRRDPNAVDLAETKVRLAEDVLFWPVRERSQLVYRMEIPALHRFFRVGYEEYVFISLLDGNTTVPQACGLAAAQLGNRAPTANQAASIQRWLLKNDLAYIDGAEPPIRDPKRPTRSTPSSPLKNLNPFWIKLPISRDGRWLRRIADQLCWCFSTPAVLMGLAVIVIGAAILMANWGRFVASTTDTFSANNWIWLLAAWVILKVIHELGHAVCCQRHDGEVHELGLVFILLAPLAYVDVTSCWRNPNRWKRIAVSSAGMFIELIIAAVATILWVQAESPEVEQLLYNLIFTAGISTLLFNANALMRFDGYFILADLVQIPNLYGESMTEVRRISRRVVFGIGSDASQYSGWRLNLIRVYGVAALLWKMGICLSLSIAASTMFAGAGIVLAMLGIGLWFGKPLLDLAQFCQRTYRMQPGRLVRGVIVGSAVFSLAVAGILWLPIPTANRVPAVARYRPDTLVRSRADGFVKQVHVRDEAVVSAGDLLMELENAELTLQLERLEITLQVNLLRQRKAVDEHDASAQLVLKEQQQGLAEQIEQRRQQVDGLRLTAPRSGRVVARNLMQMVGRYIREGDSLLTIAEPDEKELLAVVHQNEVAAIRDELGTTIPIRLANFDKVQGKLQRIDPRASDRLLAPSLAAVEGGPLAVRAASEDDETENEDSAGVRLIQPHFHARIELDDQTAREVAAGMRTQIAIGYRTDPLASRLRTAVRHMWHQAHGQ